MALHPSASALRDIITATDCVTTSLQLWCEEYGIGQGVLRAILGDQTGAVAPPQRALDLLGLAEGETLRHRWVTLWRGDAAVLNAHNWYVPERLSPRARDLLDTTDTPFGSALVGAGQTRRNIAVTVPRQTMAALDGRAWSEAAPEGSSDEVTPGIVLKVSAVVSVRNRPVSFVEERFRAELVGGTGPETGPEPVPGAAGQPRPGAAPGRG